MTTPLQLLAFACLLAPLACGGSVYKLGDAPGDAGDGGSAGDGAPAQASAGGNGSSCVGSGCGGDTGSGNAGSSTTGFDDGGSGSTIGYEDASATGADDAGSGVVGPSCAFAPVVCSGGATGYGCTSGNPEDDTDVALSCTSGTIQGTQIDYCCFPWPGAGGPCAPLPEFPCDGNSYAYQCAPGTLPSTVDPKLSCGTNFPDSNGDNDFCCTYQ